MRSISALVCLLLFDVCVQPAFARIGEPLDQLTARYGPGTNAGKDVLIFHKQNWTITVWLMDGISVQENYQKPGGATDEI